jgi:hypothetical protein
MKQKVIVSLLLFFLIFPIGLAHAQFGEGSCKSVTYSNITPDVFECMKQDLMELGIYVPPEKSGELSGSGVTAYFEWDGESKLTIQVKEKPFFVSCKTINDEIGKFAQDCQS